MEACPFNDHLGPMANLKTPWKQPDECECGHAAFVHVLLPGHPDGATECHGEVAHQQDEAARREKE